MGDDLAREELKARNAELERQLEAVTREFDSFAYSVSHDLRAPLRHITAFAGILERAALTRLDETERSSVTAIKEAADRMDQLINDLLRLSRIGRAEMNCTSLPLEDVVRQAQHDLAPETADRKIDWRVQPLPTVKADPNLLRHAFVQLLGNALKFTRPRDVAEIEVGAREEPDRWVVHIRDNGVGFDPKSSARIFNVFQRCHTEREFEGTGVGLTLVRRIISRHGGETWAEGRPNEGATFFFSLPKH